MDGENADWQKEVKIPESAMKPWAVFSGGICLFADEGKTINDDPEALINIRPSMSPSHEYPTLDTGTGYHQYHYHHH